MGFSTSGAAAIMLIAFLIAASAIFPTIFATGAETGDAFAAQADQSREQANTEIGVTSVEQEYEDATEEGDEEQYGPLTVTVANNGTTSLSVQHTDLLLDGTFIAQTQDGVETTVVVDDGTDDEEQRSETDIWPPGTHLVFEVDSDLLEEEFADGEIDRVKVVTETGITDVTETIELTELSEPEGSE